MTPSQLEALAAAAAGTGVVALAGAISCASRGRRRRPVGPLDEPSPAPTDRTLRFPIVPAATAGVVTVGLAVIGGPFATMAVAGAVAVMIARRRHRGRRLDRAAIEAALPDAVDLLVVGIHAGLSLRRAVDELGPSMPRPLTGAFAAVAHRLRRGQPLAEAIDALADELGPTAVPITMAIGQADRDGLAVGTVLDRLATEARALRRRHAEAEARKLPVRLSFPLVVCTLPSFVLLVIAPAVLGALSSLRGSAP